MDIIFDMETGDPDDLITLILLLMNPDANLKAVTCYQGSPIQVGLIKHVLNLAQKDIPIGGTNSQEPAELSPYYTSVIGKWSAQRAQSSPVEVFKHHYTKDTTVLTGAALTNIQKVLEELPELEISSMTTQGGYLGALATTILPKFKGRKEVPTYNLSTDVQAFSAVNYSSQIKTLTYVTKDLCHGFVYTPEVHSQVTFATNPLGQLLKGALEHYALAGKSKALHDPLAMLFMLYPHLGSTMAIEMSYRMEAKGRALFSSVPGSANRFGLIQYDQEGAWNKFMEICSLNPEKKLKVR